MIVAVVVCASARSVGEGAQTSVDLKARARLLLDGWKLDGLSKVGSKLVTAWRSPNGKRLHSVETNTDPPFIFAYNPLDMDMARMAKKWVLEPAITLAWNDAARSCCGRTDGPYDVVDVGANFGWFSLFSAALGCRVLAFETVPEWNEAFALGLALNRGFSRRVRVVKKAVHSEASDVALHVPKTDDGRSRFLGMTYMNGSAGMIKGYSNVETYVHVAKTASVDDFFQDSAPTSRVCVFKADVEGYEPQVFATAQRLFLRGQVQHVHMEMTRSRDREQSCAILELLTTLRRLGFTFTQSTHAMVDRESLPIGSWSARRSNASGVFLPFPSESTMARARRHQTPPMKEALVHDFTTFSTNIVGVLTRSAPHSAPRERSWASTGCRKPAVHSGQPLVRKGVDDMKRTHT